MASPSEVELGAMDNPVAVSARTLSGIPDAGAPGIRRTSWPSRSAIGRGMVAVLAVVGAIAVVTVMNVRRGHAPSRVVLSAEGTETKVSVDGKVLAQSVQDPCPGDTRGHRGRVVCDHDATHRVCAKIGDANTSFWSFTGQRNWCNQNLYPDAFCAASPEQTCAFSPQNSLPCDGLPCSRVPLGVSGRTSLGCQPSCPTSDSAVSTVCGEGGDGSVAGTPSDGTWCICKWATAEWIGGVWPATVHRSTPRCPSSIEINCGATDICNTPMGLFFSYADFGVDLAPAHDCAKQKCVSIWRSCADANPSYAVS